MSWRVGVSTRMDKDASSADNVGFGSQIGSRSLWRAGVLTVEVQEDQQVSECTV